MYIFKFGDKYKLLTFFNEQQLRKTTIKRKTLDYYKAYSIERGFLSM